MTEDPRTTIIDILPDGSVRPPAPTKFVLPRWAGFALAGAAVGLSLVVMLWLAVMILPIVAVAVAIGIVVARFKGVRFGSWRLRRGVMPVR